MECPNCKHATSKAALLQCSHCGESFERGLLEELGHIDYLKKWVDEHHADLGAYRAGIVQSRVAERQRKLLKEIKGTAEVPPTGTAPVVQVETPVHTPLPVPVVPLAPVEVKPTPVAEATPALVIPIPVVVNAEAKQIAVPTRVAISAPASKPKPAVAPKPAAPPKPKQPPIDWRKVITDAATSGALLRALLYLGAFMIVISATVLVVRFWANFSQPLQLLFIASVPLTFYAGGWALRTRLQLIQAGTVLTGIGAVLVAVDFGAIYQFGGLAGRVNGAVYWLAATLFCTALYAFTARRLKGEFFNYLTLLSGTGVLLTFTRLLNLPLDWSVASITASGALMAIAAGRVSKAHTDWQEILRASRYLAQILIPVSLMYIILLPIQPPMGHMLAFLFATIGYAVLAWQFPALIFAYAAIAASLGAIFYGLRVTELPIEWYATAASILAPGYIFIGQRAQRATTDSKLIQSYVQALSITGLILITLAALGGFSTSFDNMPAGVIAMTFASLDLAICAFVFGSSLFTLFASSSFILPFLVAFGHWLADARIAQPVSWMAVGIGGLALAYILIGAGLKKVPAHADWLYAVGHVLAGAALFFLPRDYLVSPANWTHIPSLVSLGIGIGIYLLSFILQNSGRHPSLSAISNWLPHGAGKSIFLWPLGFLVPIWLVVAWAGYDLPKLWIGTMLAVLGLTYIGTGQWLFKFAKEYRLPFHTYAYLLCALGVLTAIPSPLSASIVDRYPLLTALLITVASATILARLYDRIYETVIASVLFIWPFQLSLEILKTPVHIQSLAYVVLGSLAYTSIAVYLNRNAKSREKFHHAPVFVVGYSLVAYAVIASIIGRSLDSYIPWIGVMVPLIATGLLTFSAAYFKADRYSSIWAWAATLTFTIAFGQSLTLFKVPAAYHALAWVGIAAFYMLFERTLFFNSQKENRDVQKFWSGIFQQPWIIFAMTLTALGLLLSLPDTFAAFGGMELNVHLPILLTQISVVALVIASARLYQNRWLMFLEPFIIFLPATLFFIAYGKQIFGLSLTTPQYALIWTALGIVHVIVGTVLNRSIIRYSHGLYLGGYIFLAWAIAWSVFERATLVWTLGFGILVSIASALLVHFGRHQTWDEFIQLLFGESTGTARTTTRNAFQWLAAWTFPLWCVILLREINVSNSFAWLGLVVPAVAYLGLALWFQRVDSSYSSPLFSAAQFYTIIGLLISVPVTVEFFGGAYESIDNNTLLPFILVQATIVVFYSASAWISGVRSFAHVAAWLSILPVTIAWRTYGFAFTHLQFVIPWLLWSTVLIGIGFALDKNKIRYSHGSYLAGYMLAGYALAVSTTHRLTNIYALTITVLLALISHVIVHYGRHHSFEDFISTFWHKTDETTRQIVATFFLFFAAYAFPVLLTQVLAHLEFPLAWRGVSLAIVAPLYIAIGLFISRSKSRGIATVPTWALYSAGYALTAIGALVSFENEELATYVLIVNTVVYGVSAYIFQQAFWLYLSTILTPIIALLVLHQTDRFESTWVAWIFIALAFVYLGIGQLFDRNRKSESSDIHPFAAPFYAPGFLLSAIALAVASSDRMLAIQIYSAGVILYVLSGWLFRETLFIYPAAWLAAVPYYLAITLTPLEVRWYGLAWLPLIVLYIAIGKIFFHKQTLAPLGQGMLVQWLTHPAVPFYLLAYALSVSMISLSYVDPLAITIAFGIAAILYFSSAFLFRTPGWIYASLFAVHMTLLTSFTLNPKGGEAYSLALPFHALTWVMALLGYGFSQRAAASDPATSARTDDQREGRSEMFKLSLVERLLGHPWSRPFFVFAFTDIIVWQSIALNGYNTTFTLAIGHALLFALFSILWVEGALVYGAVGFGLLAVSAWMARSGFVFSDAMAVFGGIGFGLYLLARLIEPISARFKSWTVWLAPLTSSAITLTAFAVLVNLPFIADHMTSNAATLAFAGALYVTIAYRGRQFVLGYLGMALLEIAWVIVLFMNDVLQPQFYAIPSGLYFMGIAYLENQRNRRQYATGIEILGLGVLLVTSFVQSLNATGLPYFVLLMAEALLVLAWGWIQKRRIPFFTGIGTTVLNVLAQAVVLVSVHDINRWFVAFGVGLLIMSLAIYIERSREQLRAYSRALSETLEKWE